MSDYNKFRKVTSILIINGTYRAAGFLKISDAVSNVIERGV